MSHVLRKTVKAEDFLFHRDKFEFILTYYKDYASVPAGPLIEEQFDGYETASFEASSLDFYIDNLKRDSLNRKITKAIEEDAKTIGSDPSAALRSLIAKFTQLAGSGEAGISHTDRDAIGRLAWYEERRVIRNRGSVTGVPTGLKYFNDKKEGFQYGNLVTLVGSTWIGKSWMLLYFGAKAFLAGNRVLLVSCEMTKDEEELRFDVIMAKLKGMELNYNDIRTGGGAWSEKYEAYLKELGETDNWLTADASDIENFEIADLGALADRYKPDVLLIDGMEMLQDKMSKNRQGWEEAKSIIRQAKMLATSRNILVVATAQANRAAADRMPRLKDIAYSFDVVRASDTVIAFSRDAEDEDEQGKSRFYTVQKERNGTGQTRRMKLHFNPTLGEIYDVPESEDRQYDTFEESGD